MCTGCFSPEELSALQAAFEEVCRELNVDPEDSKRRANIACMVFSIASEMRSLSVDVELLTVN
jgi:hypothetical protein